MFGSATNTDPRRDALTILNSAVAPEELKALPGVGTLAAEVLFSRRPPRGFRDLEQAQRLAESLGLNWNEIANWRG